MDSRPLRAIRAATRRPTGERRKGACGSGACEGLQQRRNFAVAAAAPQLHVKLNGKGAGNELQTRRKCFGNVPGGWEAQAATRTWAPYQAASFPSPLIVEVALMRIQLF